MRSLRRLVVLGLLGASACSSRETPPPGSGGGGPGTDGGGPGTDGGPIGTNDCDGVAPASLGTAVSYAEDYDSKTGVCGLAVGNGDGTMAHRVGNDLTTSFTLINPSGGVNARFSQSGGGVFALPAGFLCWRFDRFAGTTLLQSIFAIDDFDRSSGPGTTFSMYSPVEGAFVGDVNGGAAHAGTIQLAGEKNQRRVMTFDAGGAVRWAPRDLAMDSAIFGLGVDLNGRMLVIQDGYAQCAGCILAQWFDGDGTPLTGSFTLLAGFAAGPATRFETAPLIGGGLAVRRMDADRPGQAQRVRSQWLVTVESGNEAVHAAPGWMTTRPDTNLALARGRSAYAVLPNGGFGQPCTQTVELVSPSGNSCASWTLALARDRSCDTLEVRLGLDGTILQRLPFELESDRDGSGRTKTCTLRFWPAALH